MWQLAGSYYRFNIATLLFHPQYAPFKHTLPGLGNRYSQALGHADTTRTWMMLSDSCPMPLGQRHRSFSNAVLQAQRSRYPCCVQKALCAQDLDCKQARQQRGPCFSPDTASSAEQHRDRANCIIKTASTFQKPGIFVASP